ncbi:MAG: hypothetical protein JWM56_901 [Candidatus Peribacteria bacterium]|nr:hypothetical protein [Candidatus Peribacteria bacterium]
MASSDESSAITHKDLEYVVSTILSAMQDMEERIMTKVDVKIDGSESRMLLAMEQLRHDVVDTQNDKFSQHDDRLVRLEQHAGFSVS